MVPRKGRELEKLVATLEGILSRKDVEIKSPDYIVGVNSGSRREIDVSLRTKVGSHEVLITLECRDRQKTDDVTWIEQLATKRADILASKTVAISSSGFSKGARRTAARLGIELRSVESITTESIADWIRMSTLTKVVNHAELLGVEIHQEKTKDWGHLKKFIDVLKANPDAVIIPFLVHIETGDALSIAELLEAVINENSQIFDGLAHEGDVKQQILRVIFTDYNRYKILTEDREIRIGHIFLKVNLWVSVSEEPISEITQYSKITGEPIAQSVRFETEYKGKTIELTFHSLKGRDDKYISVQVSPSDDA